ncbi:MAG: putative lipid II flippase FtsW, partial [Candidatus Uhrbacteria bacterium]
MTKEKSDSQPIDYRLLGLVGLLLIIGLVMLASASAPQSYTDHNGDSFYLFKHQIFFGLIPGLFLMYCASRIPYTFWKKRAWELLLISIGLLVLVFIPGIGSGFGTSHSWLSVGGLFSLQPAEIVKLTFLFYLAAWLEKRGSVGLRDTQAGLIPFISVLGAVVTLIALQPDVGTMAIIVAMAMVVYFVAGAPILHIIGLMAAGSGLLGLLIAVAPYRAARFTTFLYPELDPQGVGYHINQALLAIGSGGIFGLGYGASRQKFEYLPEVAGDSIFAVTAEEMGMIFCLVIIVLFLLFFYRAVKVALNAPDVFGKLVAIGIASWLTIQAFVNIGSMVSVMPMTGVTLPFMSYGGTSLAISLAAVGV